VSAGFSIRPLTAADAAAVLALHKAAAVTPGGLARMPDEVTAAYVDGFLAKTARDGVALAAWSDDGDLCGEIHVARMTPALFAHVLSDLTVAVHPDWQGRGVGSALFQALIARARTLTPAVGRIELMAGAGNTGAIRLYERLGFRHEGRFIGRGRLSDGRVEDDVAMALMLD
jgi:ribosomal protein S18 acetylase RimI-like enzyme